MGKRWESYEEVATYLLNKFAEEFKLSHVEGKQSLLGVRSGTNWIIDAKGFRADNEGIIIVECRRFTIAKQNQERIGGLAYRILDTGAKGGILVSPLGLQTGAKLIANAEGIISVELHKDSTPSEFSMKFLNKIFVGMQERMHLTDTCDASIVRICEKCQNSFSLQNNEWICLSCSVNA